MTGLPLFVPPEETGYVQDMLPGMQDMTPVAGYFTESVIENALDILWQGHACPVCGKGHK